MKDGGRLMRRVFLLSAFLSVGVQTAWVPDTPRSLCPTRRRRPLMATDSTWSANTR